MYSIKQNQARICVTSSGQDHLALVDPAFWVIFIGCSRRDDPGFRVLVHQAGAMAQICSLAQLSVPLDQWPDVPQIIRYLNNMAMTWIIWVEILCSMTVGFYGHIEIASVLLRVRGRFR